MRRAMTMRMPLVCLVSLALVGAGCASAGRRAKQQVLVSAEAVGVALGAIQDAGMLACDASTDLRTPIRQCTETAAKIGMTTERHQALSRALSKAFEANGRVASALLHWRAGDPPPDSLSELQSVVGEAVTVARALLPSEVTNKVADAIQRALTAIGVLLDRLRGQ